jgi:hypothetical protein
MTEIDILQAVAQVGFPIAVAVFLLWKGYTQDKEYLAVLIEIKTQIQNFKKGA